MSAKVHIGFFVMLQAIFNLKKRAYLFIFLLVSNASFALEFVYQEPSEFVAESFEQEPSQHVLWFTQDVKSGIHSILEHDYPGLRLRYWAVGERTLWILEEIGKVKPITAGYLIEGDEILNMKVLIYRESHGAEVRFPFFSDQFKGLQLDDKNKLSNDVDGISGATLSVNALTKLARVALFLHKEVTK